MEKLNFTMVSIVTNSSLIRGWYSFINHIIYNPLLSSQGYGIIIVILFKPSLKASRETKRGKTAPGETKEEKAERSWVV